MNETASFLKGAPEKMVIVLMNSATLMDGGDVFMESEIKAR